ncbi:enolase-phosphatase E1 [Sporothrix epigloea]|uniref:Enolase-phosphatase E1 n=1 Tax=Sporothrix epigloea TaxID=1892477 RepID=A0ABP0DYL9_9PEZI
MAATVAKTATRVVLLDIVLASKWDSPVFAPYRDAFPEEYRATPATLTAHVQELVARDVKASYLKSLQGLLWKEGYASGALKAPLFADVLPALSAWHALGIKLMIYSSGSVPAQKLLFQHTSVVDQPDTDPSSLGKDINPLLSDYFDTVNAGPKTAPASYLSILTTHAAEIPDASHWLFLSDNLLEVAAAKEAGLQSYVVQRPGNAPLPASVANEHRVISTFDGLEL